MAASPLVSRYRSHTCNALREGDVGQTVTLSGWIFRKRNHGNLLFVDLRDHYGVTQCVLDVHSEALQAVQAARVESVIRIEGKVVTRAGGVTNAQLATGAVEVQVHAVEVLSEAGVLPFPIDGAQEVPEDSRLRHRFLDLRRKKLHDNIVLRSKVISSLRRRMQEAGFLEYATPILTSSSPEGARDYLVPSRVHPGKFYALPQAPQQFKQLLMVSGFDRYFQIAPCFRDEDARADRSPGEFYQLDIEMAFVEQEDVFATIEPILAAVYREFSDWDITLTPFPRIAYHDAIAQYGSDKPDLRNPLIYREVSAVFAGSGFAAFANAIAEGAQVFALRLPGAEARPRRFYDDAQAVVRAQGLGGMGYVVLQANGATKGPLAKFVDEAMLHELREVTEAEPGDAIVFVCGAPQALPKPKDKLRQHLGEAMDLIAQRCYRFLWVVDFPFYERDDDGNVAFSHNPFSMPQGGLDALENQDPLTILAHQYDIVCNGVELSSGAIRNHRPDVMQKAFALAGYGAEEVEARFGGMLDAFRHGAPPHGGLAPGVDRMVMQLAQEQNIREVIAFPMNQQAQDLLMDAPAAVTDKQLRELNIALVRPEVAPEG